MSNIGRSHAAVQVVAVIASLLLATTAAGAGMAELGQKKNLTGPESATDMANGDGLVILTVGNDDFVPALEAQRAKLAAEAAE